MISDSLEYKDDLKREVIRIKKLLDKVDISDLRKYRFKLEKFLFVSSFLIRKLIESKKISDELEEEEFLVWRAPVRDLSRAKDFISGRNNLGNYYLQQKEKVRMPLLHITNMFVHSYIFTLSLRNSQFELLVTSDWQKKYVYFIKLSTFFRLCERVIDDHIKYLHVAVKPGQNHRSLLKKSRKSPRTRN